MPTSWSVWLVGELEDLKTLVDLGVGVSEENSGFVLRRSDLDSLSDGAQVRDEAIKIITALNGLAKMGASNFRPVTVGGVGGTHDGGTIVVPAPAEARACGQRPRVLPLAPSQGNEKWLRVARQDRAARQALQFFAATPTTPERLWKVYEVIRDELGGPANVIGKGWATHDEIDSFRSVHYPSVLGENARHGVEPTRPAPRHPMSFAQAQEFIRRLLAHWLDSK
jgi:hypothetical protein